MITINTNLSSLIAQSSLKSSTQLLNQAVERMSTGYKINHAKDNAANYSISTSMSTKLSAYDIAADNVAMGMDLVTTANDTISLMQNKASRLHALCTQARNGTYGTQSIDAINSEAAAIMAEIDRLYSTAEYNGQSFFEETGKFIANPISYTADQIALMTPISDSVTQLDPSVTYSISSLKELEHFRDLINSDNNNDPNFEGVPGVTIVLADNIDMSSISDWTSIGWFAGTFDGNGHIIKNLTVDSNYDEYASGVPGGGLFDNIEGEVKNLGLLNVNIKVSEVGAGALAAYSYGTISNCYAVGNITADCTLGPHGPIGGLIGQGTGEITDSYAVVNVSSEFGRLGGLAGQFDYGTINNCYAAGNVKGSSGLGGLVGQLGLYGVATINNSYATGNVIGNASNIGGLVGRMYDSNITNCYATGNVTGNSDVGGLLGEDISGLSTITNSYSTGVVNGTAGATSVSNSDDWDGTCFTYGIANISGSGNARNVGVFSLQVGINADSSNQIAFDTNFIYGLSAVKVDITSDRALDSVDDFIKQLSTKQTELGAVQNRLESALDSI